MRLASLLLVLMLAGSAAAATLYRWVDDDGVIHYSDRPQPGADVVEIREAQSYEPPSYSTPSPATDRDQRSGVVYRSVQVVQPTEDEVLWNIEGRMAVAVQVDPPLQPGHAVQVYFDGQAAGDAAQGGGSFEVDNVWRGTHTLQAAVVDETGRELLRSGTRTFHVRQTSVQNPRNPQTGPRPTPR